MMPAGPAAAPPAVTFTRVGLRRGFLAAQGMVPGVLLYGMVFGVFATDRNLSLLQAVLMSAFIYSGTAQMAVLQGTADGSLLILPLVISVLVINARYVLYSAAVQPWLVAVRRPRALASLFFLGDGSWALSMREYTSGGRDAAYVLGSSVACFAPWVLGTALGHWLAGEVPDPTRYGLDFMLVAFAAAIGVASWRARSDLAIVLPAAAVAWALYRWVPGAWYIVGAGLTGAIVGAWRYEAPAAPAPPVAPGSGTSGRSE